MVLPQKDILIKRANQTPLDEDNHIKLIPRPSSKDPQWIAAGKNNPLPSVDPVKRFQLTEKELIAQDHLAEETRKRLLTNALKPLTSPKNENIPADIQKNSENALMKVNPNDMQKLNSCFGKKDNRDLPVVESTSSTVNNKIIENTLGVEQTMTTEAVFDTTFVEGFGNDLAENLNNRIIVPVPPFLLPEKDEVTTTKSVIQVDLQQAYEVHQFRKKEILAKDDFLEFYVEHLEVYERLKTQNIWTEQKKECLKTLNKRLTQMEKEIPLSLTRDEEEFLKIKTLVHNLNESWANLVLDNLSKVPLKDCRTLEQFKLEHERQRDALMILKDYGHKLPEPIFHEIVRRAGVIVNNDAMYKDDFGNSVVVKEGEGSSLHSNSYKYISKNPEIYIKESFSDLTSVQFNELFTNIEKGDYFVGIFKNDFSIINNINNKFVDSGDEIHMNVITAIKGTNGATLYISMGCFTSNKDVDTIKLTAKQYVNKDEKEQKEKEQRFRPYKQPVLIKKTDITEYVEATAFARSTDINGQNVHEKIVNSIKNNSVSLRENPVREPHIITRDRIQQIALTMQEETLQAHTLKLKLYEKALNSISEEKRAEEELRRKAQYDNILKEKQEAAIRRNASPEVQKLYNIRDELASEKQQIKNNRNDLKTKFSKKQQNDAKAN